MNSLVSRREILRSAAVFGVMGMFPNVARSAASSQYRVAVIGHTGRGDYGHGMDTLWLSVPATQLVAVADPDEAGLAKASERLKIPSERSFSDYRAMLAQTKPDIVAIAPRHVDQHCEMAIAAARSGAKGIYIEKPFCRDLVEADQIIEACQESNTKLAIAHRNRHHPVLPVILQLIDDGKLGKILEIRLRGKEDQRGGLLDLWVLGSHLLNLAHYFSGEPRACSAGIYQDGHPVDVKDLVEGTEGVGPLAGNEVHARFETENGLPLFFDSIQGAGSREAGFGLQLIGSEGIIDLRADREPLAHFCSGNPHRPGIENRKWIPISSAGVGQQEPIKDLHQLVGGHLAAAQDLLAAISEDRAPKCSAEDGRTVMEMTMAIFASHRAGGKRVEIPLKNRSHPFADW
jgi:predicted dehydrogenase